MFAVVLVHPEIRPTTGNVIRLTANTATELHLVEAAGLPHGRPGTEARRPRLPRVRARRRAPRLWACRAALDAAVPGRRWWAFTTQAARSPDETRFARDDVLVFGCESAGLPDAIVATFPRIAACASRWCRTCAA